MDVEGLFPDAAAGRMAGGAAHPFRRCEQHVLTIRRERLDRRPGRSGNRGGPGRHRAVFCDQVRRRDQGAAEDPFGRRPQLFRCRQKVVSIINLGSVRAIENMVGLPVHPLRFPRQPLCRGLAGLARVRTARPDPCHRRGAAEGGEADHAAAPPSTSIPKPPRATSTSRTRPDAPPRPCRLRGLCRGDRRRHHWRRRCDCGGSGGVVGFLV